MSQKAAKSVILLVDDNDAHRLIVKRAIKDLPYSIVEAKELSSALKALSDCSEDLALAIIDLNLDGESGLAVLKEVRKLGSFSNVPVVVISTSLLETDVAQSYSLGASCYIYKSSDPNDFSRDIKAAIRFFLN